MVFTSIFELRRVWDSSNKSFDVINQIKQFRPLLKNQENSRFLTLKIRIWKFINPRRCLELVQYPALDKIIPEFFVVIA